MEENSSEPLETGLFFFNNGAKYEGEWRFAHAPDEQETEPNIRVRHGTGTYTEGDYTYKGEWNEDKMHGTGEFHFASGAVYRGGFHENVYQGYGTYTTASGATYKGQWELGKMHGDGSYTDKDGRTWEGQFYNGSGPHLKRIL